MKDQDKTKQQLIQELDKMRRRMTNHEKLEAELKRTRDDLVISEAKYKSLIEKAGTAIATADVKGKFTYVNKALCKMMGYSKEELIGKPFSKFLHPEDKKWIMKIFWDAWKGPRKELYLEFRVLHKKGHVIHCSSRPTVSIHKSKIIGFNAIITDITEYKKSEEKLKEREKRFRSLPEAAMEGIAFHDKGVVLEANNKFYEIFGYDPNEVLGRQVIPLMVAPESRELMIKQIASGKESAYEVICQKKDGTKFPAEIHAKPADYKGRKVRVASVRDTTERKKTEEQLFIANERLNHLLSSSSGVIYTAKCSGDYAATYVSDNVARMVGFKPQEFLGESSFWFDHIHPDDVPRISTEVSKVLDKGFHSSEYRFKIKDSTYIWVLDEMKLVRGVDGKPLEIIGFRFDITKLKRAEEALRESEAKYRSIMESTDDSVYAVDGDCRYIYMNEKNLSRLSLPSDKVIGKMYGDFHSKEGTEKFKKRIKQVLRTGKSITHEYQSERDGKFFLRTYSPVRKPDDKPNTVIVSSKDISDLRKVEEKVKIKSIYLDELIETAPEGIILTDKYSYVLNVNRKFLELFGYTKEEVVGHQIDKVVAKDNYLNEARSISKRVSKGEKIELETVRQRKDGKSIDVSILASPIKVDGNLAAVYGIYRDITDRKKAEEKLKASEELYRSLSNNIPGMIYREKSEWSVDVISKSENVSGYSPEEFFSEGVKWFDIIHPEDKKRIMRENTEMTKNREDVIQEYKIIAKDGSIRWVEDHKSPRYSEDGRFQYTDGVVFDFTERKLAEAKILDYQNDLKRLSTQIIKSQEEERRRISRELHDEIGQALTGVSINLSAIEKELPQDLSPGTKNRFFETNRLVDTMLEQIQSISLSLRPSMLDDLGLIAALRWYIDRFEKRTNIKTQFHTVNVKKRFQSEIDTTIYRIVQEALTNVARHTEADLVSVCLKGIESQIEVSIEDNGKGFDLEDFRSRPPTTHGIGLFGIQERVALLNGNTRILTNPGMGTKIIINIPIGVRS